MTVAVEVADLRYLSERQIRIETGRSAAWVHAHTPLMDGCDYTPTGQRRVPRVCAVDFIRKHRPATCQACNADAGVAAPASSAR